VRPARDEYRREVPQYHKHGAGPENVARVRPVCDKLLVIVSSRQHVNLGRLHELSERLEELFARVSACGQQAPPPELADEIASTAGEVMLELAGLGADALARAAAEDAVRLRETARTLNPSPARLIEGGATLTREVEQIIRADRQAA
jgi:hypothetical protein